MYKVISSLLFGCLMTSLIALKPYDEINQRLGIAADTMATAVDSSAYETLVIEQPAAVVLEKSVTDTLAEQVTRDKKQLDYWNEQKVLVSKELADAKAAVRKKQEAIQKEKQQLLSLDQIKALQEKQKTAHNGKQDIDPATGLLRDRAHP